MLSEKAKQLLFLLGREQLSGSFNVVKTFHGNER
jgi:hypothetical protein